jgi:hypothetical protein
VIYASFLQHGFSTVETGGPVRDEFIMVTRNRAAFNDGWRPAGMARLVANDIETRLAAMQIAFDGLIGNCPRGDHAGNAGDGVASVARNARRLRDISN